MKLGLLALAFLSVSACACRDRAAPRPASESQCAQACAILRDANCHAGTSPACLDACERDQAQGVGMQLDVGCVLEAGVDRARLSCCNVGTCEAP